MTIEIIWQIQGANNNYQRIRSVKQLKLKREINKKEKVNKNKQN